MEMRGVTREMLCELIATVESVKFYLMGKYNKNMNFVQGEGKDE